MNDKEAREIRRRFKPDKTWINAVHGCYVNESKKVISTFRESIQTMVQDESERFLALLKKPISGTIGRSIINLEFSARQVMESEEHKLLMAMRACGLENEELLAAFYNRVAQTLNIDGGYIILLVHDTYSVPYRSSDGHAQHDASDEEFSYFICSICPVKQTQPVLSYQLAENCFNALNNGFAVSAPQLGFMFPAFDNRAANIYATLYYTKSTADNHPEFTTAVFGIEPPMPAASQKEVFSEILSEALEEECRIETVQSVQEHIGQIMEMHKENHVEEPLALSKNELGAVLSQCGVSAERVQAFSDAFDAHFGTDAALPPVNMIDKKQFVITTPEVTVKVDPERGDMIELRKIDGLKYILIPADDVVEVNGVKVQFGEK